MARLSNAFMASLFLMAVASGFGEPVSTRAGGGVTVTDLFRPPAIQDPVVNRKGDRLAALIPTKDDHTAAVIFNLETGKRQAIRGEGDRDIDELEWLDDRHILLPQSQEKLYADALFVVDSETLEIYAVERHSAVSIIAVPKNSPMKPLIWMRHDAYDASNDAGAMQIDATRSVDPRHDQLPNLRGASEHKTALAINGTAATIVRRLDKPKKGMTEGFLANKDGELAFALTIDNGTRHLFYLKDEDWAESAVDLDTYNVVMAGDTADELIAIGPRQEGKPRALLRLDAITGRVTGTLYQDPQYDPTLVNAIRDPKTRVIVGLSLQRRALETIWLDAQYNAIQKRLNEAFPGKIVCYLGSDEAQSHLVASVFSDRAPVSYYMVDLEKHTASLIASSAPWIPEDQMRPVQRFEYSTRDGYKVEAYLTLPANASKETPPPLVVLVHGGPWVRDTMAWDPEVQLLANRGYAVFQPNYRGSSGYNWIFPAGDQWEFRKMHDDVTDGVKKLVASGRIDRARIAIMGASFGGYLAMCGSTYESELYCCAITEAGVFDWKEMMRDARQNRYESTRYQWYLRNLGDPKKDTASFAEISPIHHIDQVKVPILVAHGKDDNVVSVEQSLRLVEALKKNHVPHKVFFKGGEGHGMFRSKNRVEYYTVVETFLEENFSKCRPESQGEIKSVALKR